MKKTQTIYLHQQAPQKPEFGHACNGCGVCCAAEPCPVAHVLLWQFHGACRALHWSDSEQRYQCGMLHQPQQYMLFLPKPLVPFIRRWSAAHIAMDIGCDSTAVIEKASS